MSSFNRGQSQNQRFSTGGRGGYRGRGGQAQGQRGGRGGYQKKPVPTQADFPNIGWFFTGTIARPHCTPIGTIFRNKENTTAAAVESTDQVQAPAPIPNFTPGQGFQKIAAPLHAQVPSFVPGQGFQKVAAPYQPNGTIFPKQENTNAAAESTDQVTADQVITDQDQVTTVQMVGAGTPPGTPFPINVQQHVNGASQNLLGQMSLLKNGWYIDYAAQLAYMPIPLNDISEVEQGLVRIGLNGN